MLPSILILSLAAMTPASQSRVRDAGSVSTIGQPTHTYGQARPNEQVVCLRNKVSRQNECRTRAEGARVAARMQPQR